MKKSLLILTLIASFSFSACEKESRPLGDGEVFDYEFPCALGECEPCGNLDFVDPTTISKTVQQVIVEPLQYSDECGCIVRGIVKYVDCGKVQAIVSYGDGECDSIGRRTICIDGDCESSQAKTCEFDMDCGYN